MVKNEQDTAIVHHIDGNYVDIQFRGSPTLIRHIPVSGNVSTVSNGQRVAIKWEGGRPIVIPGAAIGVPSLTPIGATNLGDLDTIENADKGLRIVDKSIRKAHFAIRLAEEKHNHDGSRIDGGTW